MPEIEREYPYRVKGWAVLVVLAFFGGGAVLMGYKAAGNDPDNMPCFYWTECVLCILLVAFYGALGLVGRFAEHRVALTPTAVLLPKAPWSAKELAIEFRAITGLEVRPPGPHPRRRLEITHLAGKARIVANLLPNSAAFQDVSDSLAARVSEARASEPAV
jgi:hypothetical protein